MKPPKCRLCGHEHYGMAHVWDATNTVKTATNDATNSRGAAKRSACEPDQRKSGLPELAPRQPGETGKTANRRDRKAYNAYQREYMKKRRAG